MPKITKVPIVKTNRESNTHRIIKTLQDFYLHIVKYRLDQLCKNCIAQEQTMKQKKVQRTKVITNHSLLELTVKTGKVPVKILLCGNKNSKMMKMIDNLIIQ